LSMCNCDEHVIEILWIIGTDYSFSILKTEEEAINQLLK
jgi:hypothetical protein